MGVHADDRTVSVFVCDDSIGFTLLLSNWCAMVDGVELAGTAGSAEELRRRMADAAPDVLLLDLMLPEGPASPELVGQLRELSPGVRIVLLSSMPDDRLQAEAARVGADACASKFISMDALLAVVTGRA